MMAKGARCLSLVALVASVLWPASVSWGHVANTSTLALTGSGQGSTALGKGVLRVSNGVEFIEAHAHAAEWTDVGGRLSFEQVLAAQAAGTVVFAPSGSELVSRDLKGVNELWFKLTLAYDADVKSDHYIVLPLAFLDRVRFYTPTGTGNWSQHEAGDTVNISNWPEPARYPVIQLHPAPGEYRTVYLQVSQGTRTPIPLWLKSDRLYHWDERVDLVLMGIMAGTLIFLIVVCLLQAVAFRDQDFARFSVFSLFMLLGTTMYGGLLPMLLPWQTQLWSDVSQAALACLTAMAGIYLVHMVLVGTGARSGFMLTLKLFGFVGAPLALACVFVARPIAAGIVSAYVLASLALSLAAAVEAWRLRSNVALWLTLAFVPSAMGAAVVSARLMGMSLPVWLSNYALMLATVINLPLLLVALNVRAGDRHTAQARANAIGTHDPLTGLLVEHLFIDRLDRACNRFEQKKSPAVVVLFRIANFSSLKRKIGPQFIDQLLLRSVIRMRRVVVDSDNLARVGEAQFAVLLDGVDDRNVVQAMCARLIASGLMPSKGRHGGVSLNFQCVCVLLTDKYLPAHALMAALQTQLDAMSPRSRRPIRFIDQSDAGPESEIRFEPSSPGGRVDVSPPPGGWVRDTVAGALYDDETGAVFGESSSGNSGGNSGSNSVGATSTPPRPT